MNAKEHPELFDDYRYGATREEILAKLKAEDCGNIRETRDLTLSAPGNINFLDLEWSLRFEFNNLFLLRQISLTRGQTPGERKAIAEKLKEEGWRLMSAETDEAIFDPLERGGGESVEKERARFIDSALRADATLTIQFWPADFADKIVAAGKIKNCDLALDKAPENIVVLSLFSFNGDLGINFTAPLLARKDALRSGAMIKR